jgi:hypothetical protein
MTLFTKPGYSHTYRYNRLGVGDVVALDPAGSPYTLSLDIPAGWTAVAWYHTDPLVTPYSQTGWKQVFASTLPEEARNVTVSVDDAPNKTPSQRVSMTISSANYKAATGLRYTDSGANRTQPFTGAIDDVAFRAGAEIWFDADDLTTLWLDTSRMTQATGVADEQIEAWDNKGSLTSFTHVEEQAAGEHGLLTLNALAGRRGVRGNGTTTDMSGVPGVQVTGNGCTIFCVANRTGPSLGGGTIFTFSDSGTDGWQVTDNDNEIRMWRNTDQLPAYSLPTTGWTTAFCNVWRADNLQGPIFMTGSTTTPNPEGTDSHTLDISNTAEMVLFNNIFGSVDGHSTILEVYIWFREITTAEFDSLVAYTRNEYGLLQVT